MEIYKVINKLNSKVYIGKTTRTSLQRWAQHLSEAYNPKHAAYDFYFHRALRKEGKNNFSVEVVEVVETEQELNIREKYWINYYKELLGADKVYNTAEGGNGGNTRGTGWHHTDEAKQKMREHHNYNSHKNRPKHSEETKRKIGKANSGSNNGMFGRHYETSAETKLKISRARKGQLLSEEHKQKLSKAHLGKAKGKISIHKDHCIKYITTDKLEEYLADGWQRGTGRFKQK